MTDTLLVTGASGQLGRRVLAHLLDTVGITPARLIAMTRDPAKLADLAARGVDVRHGDFSDRGSTLAAFQGADRVLLVSTDALEPPGARLVQHRTAVSAAQAAGVKHVVYTSMPNPAASPIPFAPDHLQTEEALAASGLGWTVLRNAWYFENLAFSLPHALASGTWYSAAGDGRTAYVARDDCARAAAFALAAAPVASAVYDITGPVALTHAEIASAVSRAVGRPLDVVTVSDDALVQGMVAAGISEPMARIWASFDTAARLGRFATVADGVERLSGALPQTLGAFLATNARAFLPARAETAPT